MERAQQLQQRLKLPDGTGIKPLLLSFPQILGSKGANISTKLAKLQVSSVRRGVYQQHSPSSRAAVVYMLVGRHL